jgi:hypothetical protein
MPRKFNSYTNFEKEELIQLLNETPNIEEFLKLLITEFDMKNTIPGAITKNILSTNMVKLVLPMINPVKPND